LCIVHLILPHEANIHHTTKLETKKQNHKLFSCEPNVLVTYNHNMSDTESSENSAESTVTGKSVGFAESLDNNDEMEEVD